MKIRDSGMPEASVWTGFFDPPAVLDALGLVDASASVLEFGCGYGTFTLPAARRVRGTVHAIDIEASLLRQVARAAAAEGLANVRTIRRDFVADGSGLPDGAVDYAMLFNILHGEDPVALLAEARRTLRPGGLVAAMHWVHDAGTPRGPDLAIRPRPKQCQAWMLEAGLELVKPNVPLPPYHYGVLARRS